MNFIDVVKFLLQGRIVSRDRRNITLVIVEEELRIFCYGRWISYTLTKEDLVASDWELVASSSVSY